MLITSVAVLPFVFVLNPFKADFVLSFSSTTSRELLQHSRLVVDEDDLMWVKK